MPKKDLDAAIARAEYAIGAARRAHGEGGEMRLIDVAIDACKSLLDIEKGFGMEFADHAKYESIISAYEDLQQRKTTLCGGRLHRNLKDMKQTQRRVDRLGWQERVTSGGVSDPQLLAVQKQLGDHGVFMNT